jgi:hypothetical protein
MWTVQLFDTRTGRIVNNDLAVTGQPRFSRPLNGSGTVDFEVLIADLTPLSRQELRGQMSGWRYSAALCYGNYVVQAGPILPTKFTDSSSVLQVGTGDMWSLLKKRQIINPATPPSPTTAASLLPMDSTRDTVFTNLALHDIATHLVSNSCSRTGFDLPIDFPSDVGGTSSKTYPIYDLADVAARLTDLSQVAGGPDVDWQWYFDPANPGYLRCQMLVGNPTLAQTGLSLIWDYGSNLTSVDVDSDPTDLARGVYVKGNATERASTVAYAENNTLTAAGWPGLEWVDNTHTSETDSTALQGYATADIAFHSTPMETWTVTVAVAQAPFLGDYAPGTSAVFNLVGHLWKTDGAYTHRIVGIQDDTEITVKLLLQATQGVL